METIVGKVKAFRFLLGVAFVLSVCVVGVGAEEGWEFRVGAGAATTPVYEGGSDYYVTPVPEVSIGWSHGPVSIAASTLDGIGVTAFLPEYRILGQVSLNVGSSRERDWSSALAFPDSYSARTERRLEDTPDVAELFTTDLTVGYLTPVGIVGLVAGYRPTRVDPPDERGDDTFYHGFLYSAMFLLPVPVTERFSVELIALLDVMDQRYAEAWYTLKYDTPRLDRFDANRGIRSARFVFDSEYMVTDRIGLSGQIGETILFGDAVRTPFTTNRYQTTVMLTVFYSF